MAVPPQQDPGVPSVFGVLGSPAAVAASLSPQMFQAVFAELGIEAAYYVPLPVRESSPAKAMRSLARMGFRGANVTMPYKRIAAQVASDLSDTVQLSGVANTLIVTRGGRLRAESTDGDAVVGVLRARGIALDATRLVVIGAGGAATDVAVALAREGARELVIVNRSPERAEALRDLLQAAFPALGLQLASTVPIDDATTVVVSAVPAEAAPVEIAHRIGAGSTVVDLAYRYDRQPTALVAGATAAGAHAIDGREILAAQGALAFRHWFGYEPPREVMQRAVT